MSCSCHTVNGTSPLYPGTLLADKEWSIPSMQYVVVVVDDVVDDVIDVG